MDAGSSAMTEQEKKLFEMYGKKPAKNVLSNMQKERKYFDSGDYAMHKAGVSADIGGGPLALGTAIPTPEGLPHASPPTLSSSPTSSSPSMHAASVSPPAVASGPGANLLPSYPFPGGSESVSPPGAAPLQSAAGGASGVFGKEGTVGVINAKMGSASMSSSGGQVGAGMGGNGGVGVGFGPGLGGGVAIPGRRGSNDARHSPPTQFSPLSPSTHSHSLSSSSGASSFPLAQHRESISGGVPPSSFPLQHRESVSHGVGGSPVKGWGGSGLREEEAMEVDE